MAEAQGKFHISGFKFLSPDSARGDAQADALGCVVASYRITRYNAFQAHHA